MWTEESVRDFYLNNILIHELGHLVGRLQHALRGSASGTTDGLRASSMAIKRVGDQASARGSFVVAIIPAGDWPDGLPALEPPDSSTARSTACCWLRKLLGSNHPPRLGVCGVLNVDGQPLCVARRRKADRAICPFALLTHIRTSSAITRVCPDEPAGE